MNEQLLNELYMQRGLSGGAQEPMQRMDFNFGDAGMGGAFSHPLLPMLLQPAINSMFGHGGMMPAQFSPQQGFFDQWRAKQYYQARQTAMATASSADRETYVHMLRGIAQMQGTPWGLAQERSANVMAGDMAFMAPMMAQAMPDVFDQAHGTRGSATVMASFLHRAGRTGVDPATGRTGVSGDSAGILAAEMHRRFFGVDADLAGWRGISAGKAGMMYDELQTRGLMGTSIGVMTPEQRTNALIGSTTSRQDAVRMLKAQDPKGYATLGAKGLDGADVTDAISKMMSTASPQSEAMLRQFDANRIGNTLKSMSGAVAAMREIFGDMGQPNAPMAQLIEGLNSMTQGGLATMNPAQLEQTVRNTQVIARTSGLGMQALQGLTAQSAAMARDMGLDSRFGVTASQNAAEFGAAYGQAGGGNLGGWGRLDKDKMIIMENRLQLQAAASPMASRLGAVMRLADAGGVAEGTPLAAMAAAIKAGDSEFTFGGQTHSLNMGETKLRKIMADSGVSSTVALSHIRATSASQEYVDKYKTGDIARQAQPGEIRAMMSQHLRGAMMSQLNESGVTREKAERVAEISANAQAKALTDMPVDIRNDPAKRNQYMADVTRQALIAGGYSGDEVNSMLPPGKLNTVISGGIGMISQRLATDRSWGYPGLNPMLDASNPEVQRRQKFIASERKAEVAMAKALGGLGTAGPLARLMDEIQNPSGSVGDAVKKLLGAQDPDEVMKRLAEIKPGDSISAKDRLGVIMQEMMSTVAEYDKGRASNMTPEQKLEHSQRLEARISAMRDGGAAATAQMRTELVAAKLIDPKASDAAVKAMAGKVQRGEVAAPEHVRKTIGALAAAGGAADIKALDKKRDDLLLGAGFKTDELALARLGGMDSDDRMKPIRSQLEDIATERGGLDAHAAAANAIGGGVGEKQLDDVSSQRKLLDEELAKEPAWYQDRTAYDAGSDKRRRLAGAVVDRGARWMDVLLRDTKSMKTLGAGGLALAKGAHEKQQAMAQLASDNGLNLVDILSGTAKLDTPAQKEAAAKILGMQGEVDQARDMMVRRMRLPNDKRTEMDATELKALDEYQKHEALTEGDQNKKLIGSIMGTGVVGETDRAELEKLIGTGDEGKKNRLALGQMVGARDKFADIAGKAKMSVEHLRKEMASGTGLQALVRSGVVSKDDADSLGGLVDKMGVLGEKGGGGTVDSVKEALGSIKDKEAKAAEAASKTASGGGGKPSTLKLAGTVTIKDGNIDFSGATATGSTPVA